MGDPSKLTAWERWELASFDAPPEEAPPPTDDDALADEAIEVDAATIALPTAEEIEQIQQQARDEGLAEGRAAGRQDGHATGYREGHAEGHTAGYQAGQALAGQEADCLHALAERLDNALTRMESAVADELLALAVALAREVVRHEIAARPEGLLNVVHEALAQLPHQHAAIYLHPDDAALLRNHLGEQLSHAGQRIHEDFKLQRGDCLIEAGGTQIDATVAMRWQRVLAGLGIEAAWQPAAAPPAADAAATADAD